MRKDVSKKPRRRTAKDQKTVLRSDTILFKNWDEVRARLIADIRRSERLTARDFNITINCRD